jgi:hypothetical protein
MKLSIHPSVRPVIHPWMASTGKKTLAEINNLPLYACVAVLKRHDRPRGGLLSISDQKGQIHPDVHLENLKIVTIKSIGKNSHCS